MPRRIILFAAFISPFLIQAADAPKLIAPAQAIIALKEAALHGNIAAQYKFGAAHQLNGDEANAMFWFRKAARQGSAEAQFALGNLLVINDVDASHRAEGLQWLLRAAEQNFLHAQRRLGELLANARDKQKNYVDAFKWFALAARQSPACHAHVDALALKMTREETSQALRKIEEFRPLAPAKIAPALKLQGLIGRGGKRLALINGKSFEKNELGEIKVEDETIKVQCLELGDRFAQIKIEGEDSAITLKLNAN